MISHSEICFWVIIVNLSITCGWHGYWDQSMVNSSCKLNVTKFTVEDLITWKNYFSYSNTVASNESLWALENAMELIWKNQHPEDCSKAKFVVSASQFVAGFGAEIHVEGALLALALSLNRVFIDNPETIKGMKWKFNNKFCSSRNHNNKECYYEPWTHCNITNAINNHQVSSINAVYHGKETLEDMKLLRITREVLDEWIRDSNKGQGNAQITALENTKTILPYDPAVYQNLIPRSMIDLLKCGGIANKFWNYWWRAVSATYLLRPNKYTLDWLAAHRTLPLRPNERCIGAYVRRGDKAYEMKLRPESEYFSVSEKMWKAGLVPGVDRNKPGVMFFASEDPEVLESAKQWAENSKWKLLYVNLIDRKHSFGNNPRDTELKPHEDEYLALILNLEYALRCDAWVCTLASNFCRLIDELRTTVVFKSQNHYADLSFETCSHTPCIDEITKFHGFW